MSGVDDRVVSLKFDNKQFESASAQSMSTLDKLKKSLDFSTSTKSLKGLQETAGRFNLGNIGTTIEGISTKFLAMGTIGVTALVQITQQALATGEQMLKALTIDPVQAGFDEYSTNLNSIQTILSNTMAAGTNLKQVNSALAELNDYSDKTIYNFSEMARNIGTFTAAGVGLKPATQAIKGIANLAALSGSNSQQAATAMYQLSQAISAGKVSLMDWNSVVNAGMGGTVFQRALAQTAVKMGTIKEGAIKLQGPMKNLTISGMSFRESISDPKVGGWLTSGVLTKTLAQFTGDMTDAQLAAEGFSKAEIKAIQKQALAAQEAATQVKTISQAFDVAKETAGSGWAKTWQIIFGDFGTAKKDMTSLSNFINDIINRNADKRNKMLAEWSKNGGRIAGVQALKAAFEALNNVIKPIQQAWANVFPPATGKQLADLTKSVRDFFRGLILGPKQMAQIRTAFQGFFSVIKIGKTILSSAFEFFKDMFGIFTQSSGPAAGGILEVAASVGEALTNFERFLNGTNAVPAFFHRLSNSVGPVVAKIRDFANSVKDFLGSGISQVVSDLFNMGKAATTANEEGVSPLAQTWHSFADFFKGIPNIISSVMDTIKSSMSGLGSGMPDINQMIMENLQKINWVTVFKATIGTGFVAGIGLAIKGLWDAIDLLLVTPKRVIKAFADVLGGLDKALEGWGKKQEGQGLLMKAAGILALAVALKVLSTISWPDLIVGIGAMKLLFMMLGSAFKDMENMGDIKNMAKIPIMATGFLILGSAMLVFALAIKVMSLIPIGDALKGLFTMSIVVAGLLGVAKVLEKAQGDILRFSASMLLISNAMLVFAAAIFVYSKLDMSTFLKGGGMIIGFVAGLGLAMRAMPKEGQMLASAAALLLIAGAINMLIIPIAILGNMDFGTLVKGIGAIGVVLVGLVIALNAMEGALPGAAAMIVAAVALNLLAAAVSTLGNLGLGTLVVGLLGLVLVMAAVAGASLLLVPAVPAILAFGAAMVVLGAGFALLGAGALAFATAMSIIVTIMTMGMPIVEDAIKNAIQLIPLLAEGFKTFLVEFANAFTEAVPAIAVAITTFVEAMLEVFRTLIPQFVDTGLELFQAFVEGLVGEANILYDAAWSLITGFLRTVSAHLPSVIKSGTDIIVSLIKGIGDAALRITTAAGDTLIKFLEGIAKWIRENSGRLNQAGKDIVKAIIDGMVSGVASLGQDAINAISGLAGSAIDAAKNILGIHSPSKVFREIGKNVTQGFVLGIVAGYDDIKNSFDVITENIKNAKLKSLDEIKDLKSKIKDLENDKSLTANQKKQLAKYKAELKVAEAEQRKLDAAYKTMTKEHKKQKEQLLALGKDYDKTTAKLDAARDKLDDAIKLRDDYNKSVTDKYSTLPDLAADTSLDTYFDGIRSATEANLKFKATLEQLRGLGLDDNQYKKFMEQGTAIQPFLDQLLAAGGNTITELNAIDTTLTDSASQLGKSASDALYQAGVDSAQGIVDGLESHLKEITDKMKAIGKAIADELKKELGIKSPSRVTREVGKFVVKGLAQGLDENSNVIDLSARRLGKNAVESLKESLTGLADIASSEVNLQPTIAPVLDLEAFRKDAAGINDILAPSKIVPSTSTAVAGDISNKASAQAIKLQEQALAATGTTVEYTQINQSPKALSTAEIYRQTKNQLSTVKGALNN